MIPGRLPSTKHSIFIPRLGSVRTMAPTGPLRRRILRCSSPPHAYAVLHGLFVRLQLSSPRLLPFLVLVSIAVLLDVANDTPCSVSDFTLGMACPFMSPLACQEQSMISIKLTGFLSSFSLYDGRPHLRTQLSLFVGLLALWLSGLWTVSGTFSTRLSSCMYYGEILHPGIPSLVDVRYYELSAPPDRLVCLGLAWFSRWAIFVSQ